MDKKTKAIDPDIKYLVIMYLVYSESTQIQSLLFMIMAPLLALVGAPGWVIVLSLGAAVWSQYQLWQLRRSLRKTKVGLALFE